jgi:phage host-nuclease inhibitor protein Gam
MNMATRQKTKATPWVCQSKEQTQDAIRALGDAQRELTRLTTTINDQTAAIIDQNKAQVEALKERIQALIDGIAVWCEANRATLLSGGGKEANLTTGLVRWRQRPPSVSIRAMDKVVETLKQLGLGRFVRTKEEANKEAMLSDPKAVSGIAGVTIVTGVEDLVIEPFEVEVA